MADGHFPSLVSATRDANDLVNPIFVKLTDGTTAPTLTGTSLNVNLTNASVAVTATNLDIRDLVFATDKVDVSGSALGANSGVDIGDVTVNNAAGAAAVNIQDGGNSITVDGTVTANAGTGPFPVSDNGGSLTVDAVDLDIRDLTLAQDAVKISANSTANSSVNPIFVSVTTDVVSATEVHNYNTASAVASDTASNHSYTVTGTTFLLKSVIVASSGGSKIEIQTGPVASLATVAVAFIPKDGGHVQIDFNPPKEVPVTSTGTVRVIRTNRQGQAQDVYSTIIGNDLP